MNEYEKLKAIEDAKQNEWETIPNSEAPQAAAEELSEEPPTDEPAAEEEVYVDPDAGKDLNPEKEKFDPHPELDEYLASKNTTNRLRAMSQKFALQLREAREEHVVKVDTIATKALEAIRELLRASEVQVERAEHVIRYFTRWVDSGKVAYMAERIASLEATNASLGREIAALLAERNRHGQVEGGRARPTVELEEHS